MKNETINIYIPKEKRKTIDEMKVKYRLSLTTIVDILLLVTTKYMMNENGWEITKQKLEDKYLYKRIGKTSIKKPKLFKNLMREQVSKQSRYATNVLMIYLNKEISKYITKENATKYYNDLNKQMTITVDEFWDYNQFIKKQRRMLRENPNLEYKDGHNNGVS